MRRVAHWLPQLTYVTLIALAVSVLPATPAYAKKRTQNQAIDDKLGQFAEGSLLRTALAPIGIELDPAQGGVELAPLGYVEEWTQSAFNLPERVTSHASVSLNDRIYIIGGLVNLPPATSAAPTAHVWSGTLAADGNITAAWKAQPDLPAVPPSEPPGGTSPCAQNALASPGRSGLTAAPFSTGTTGYIYAVGGVLDGTGQDLPGSPVAIAVVDANGDVTGWRNGPCLPEKLQDASATTVQVNGETILYVVGGLVRRPLGLQSYGLRTTYFARLDPASGDIRKVSDNSVGWDTNPVALPIPNDPSFETGLWNASLIAHVDAATPSAPTRYALYIAGGETKLNSSSSSASVFRGTINPSTKQVNWEPSFVAALSSARADLTGVAYNGNVMFIGGRSGVDPLAEVLSNQIDGNLDLKVPDGTSNFYKSAQVLSARYNHASAIAEVEGKTYVYAFGGQGIQTTSERDDIATNTFFFGRIGGDGANVGYARSGWFISTPRKLAVDNSKVLAITWDTQIDRNYGMDVALEYRTTEDPELSETTWSEWRAVADPQAEAAGYQSKDGFNSIKFPEGVSALYFQYRTLLTTTQGTPGNWKTPGLLAVNIQIEVPGYPNLKIPEARATLIDGQLRAVAADIANRDPQPTNEPLQPVDDGQGGTFFVSVYIFKPGQTPTPPSLGTVSEIYAEVNKRQFPYGTSPFEKTITISSWCITSEDCSTPYNITRQFTEPGDYTIYLYVDNVVDAVGQPYGNVEEADVAGTFGETDNLYTLQVNVPAPCPPEGCTPIEPQPGIPTIYLPIIGKA